jgi:hypothetical protein
VPFCFVFGSTFILVLFKNWYPPSSA